MSIDYTRRTRTAPAPAPAPDVAPQPAPGPVPRSESDTEAAGPRPTVAGVVAALVAGSFAVPAWTSGHAVGAVLCTVAALLCFGPTRQAIRYTLAVAGLFVLRAIASRAGRLDEPGRVTDPAAAWRVWLNVRCAGCGW